MSRVAFQMQVRPERMQEYLEAHRAVWPDMLEALEQTGWRNYTLFHRDDGVVFAYLECDDFEASRAAIAETDVAKRWGEAMQHLLAPGTDPGADRLTEYFHLD